MNIEKYVILKKYNIVEKFLFLTRAKFIIGSLMPFFFAIPWCYFRYHDCHAYLLLFLSFFSLLFLHMAANTFNDYFDWKSGRDKKNIDYVLCSTGGSRAIDFKIISEKNMLYLSIFFLFLVFIISCYLYYVRGFFFFFYWFCGCILCLFLFCTTNTFG
ncbi:MAG TPA: UbiA prenyltransferase family protein [Candidatus Azoamicus sp.]